MQASNQFSFKEDTDIKIISLPSHNNEEIQAVPGVSKVTLLAKDTQGHHLQDHFHGKEDEDEIIKYLKEPKGTRGQV